MDLVMEFMVKYTSVTFSAFRKWAIMEKLEGLPDGGTELKFA